MPARDPKRFRRLIVLSSAALVLAGLWLAASRLFTLAEARRVAELCRGAAVAHPAAVFFGVAVAQAIGMALSLPTKALLVLLAGALLGTALGAGATELGVITGTTVLFFGCRRLLGGVSLARFGSLAARFERRLRARPVLAVAGLRLVITIPYGPITIASAASGMRYRDFALGSLLGDIPVTALYALAGSRLGSLVAVGEALSPATALILAGAGAALFAAALLGAGRPGVGGKEEG